MFWTLVAAAVAGLGAAGLGMAAYKLSKKRVGKWIIPVSAGIGILAYQISYEYSWYANQLAHQPAGTVVVAQDTTPSFFRPWTYLFPLTSSYTLLEPSQILYQESTNPSARIASFILYRIEKAPVDALIYKPHVLNCNTGELLQLQQDNNPDPSVAMRQLTEQDPLFLAVCR